ncbi:HmuY family protein [Sphingobacterium psychroaquaticum]|uniref:HmuY protein n=1 Tax=Sphingobacterium psychroaquaticum TaxID=561061 RepID=A0A1X7JKT9_9SPHI|nr:HmuY family protein [Sphingobacterium psychroaquaticum]SMG28551.1 HmuY protein [Sphingobacterium psychroaquaticum]
MKTKKIICNEFRSWLSLAKLCSFLSLVTCITLFSSCGKDKDVRPELEDGKSTIIRDLAGDVEASMGSGIDGKENRAFHTFLFRFRDQRQIWIRTKADSLQWLQSKDWDLAFTGPYNSEVFVNNAHMEFNPGFGGEAKQTSVVLLRQAYQAVTTAPSDADFDSSTINKIGWASSESSTGWFQYSLNTHIMQALTNRTYAIRLPDGKYAKLQLINAYKGNPPAVTNLNWPSPYYTFRYYVQQDGSKNLNTN